MNKLATTPAFARPAFVEDAKQEFEALIAAHPEIEYLDAVVVDLCGILRGKRMGIAEATKIFESGMQIPESVYLMDARGAIAVAEAWGWIDGAVRSREILDRLLALLWRLTRARS